jgi:enoyl-CoA hydratase
MPKDPVDHTMDVQGFSAAIDACFTMHHFGHARASVVSGGAPSLAGLDSMRSQQG